jgi:nucleotide-binding universal stress UspA family protein
VPPHDSGENCETAESTAVSATHEILEARVTDRAGFASIVVAVDLEPSGDRALPIVRALGEYGRIPVELLTVSSPHSATDVDDYELRRRAMANGWPEDGYTIAHSNHAAQAIVDHVKNRPDALLAMATSARQPIAGHLLGSVSEAVLRNLDQPVLLVGPHVPETYSLTEPTLVACIDCTDIAEAAIPVIARWAATFDGADPWVTEVLADELTATGAGNSASERVRQFAGRLADVGVTASWGLLRGNEPEVRIEEFGDQLTDPVFVTTSARWTDGRLHWRSTTHRLVQRSTRPVVVVPAR